MRRYAEHDPERIPRIYSSSFANWLGDAMTWLIDRVGQIACYAIAINRLLDPFQEDRFVVAAILLLAAILLRGQMLQMHAIEFAASVSRAAQFRAQ